MDVPMTKKIIKRRAENSIPIQPNLPPLLHRIYATRGISSLNELERGLEHLLPFHDMLGMDQAVQLLAETIVEQQRILIVGDFDADGATSTAVAIHALRAFGAKYVDYLVPNRFDFGY